MSNNPPTTLQLCLAVAIACTDTGCQIKGLDTPDIVTADYAALMLAHHIEILPGQLVAVDCTTQPPRLVYRWDDIAVASTNTGYTLAQNGEPLDVPTLRAEHFPKIQAMYAQSASSTSRLNWMDISNLSFNTMLLLETIQLRWFPGWLPEPALAIALRANPAVAWFMQHKCPAIADWLEDVLARAEQRRFTYEEIHQAEQAILRSIEDLLVYAVDPAIYDAQSFLQWDSQELTGLADFEDKVVIDVGSGTGRLAFAVACTAKTVYAVEPVGNLRAYLKAKARQLGLANVFVVDGLITEIPFADHFADITMEGHTFGDRPEQEHAEMARVTRPGGMLIHCPGNGNRDNEIHQFLVAQGYAWSRFEEPGAGIVRKYWKLHTQ